MYEVEIGGMTFEVHADEMLDYYSGDPTGRWHGWCFFAYDKDLNIFPADAVPESAITHESIVGEEGDSKVQAQQAVEATLRRVIQNKSLEGTGFYSPPADKIYPQEFPGRKPTDLEG